MAYIRAQCANCGGQLKLDDSMKTGYCMYCGSQVILEGTIQNVRIDGEIKVSGIAQLDNLIKVLYRDIDNGQMWTPAFKETYRKAVEIDPDNPDLLAMDSILIRNNKLYKAKLSNTSVYKIPMGVVNIGENAFIESDSNLTEILIPPTVTAIDDYAFAFCKGLTNIRIPESVKSIGNEAFSGTNIEEIILPKGLQNGGYSILNNCNNLKVVKNLYICQSPFNTIKNSGIDRSVEWITIRDGETRIPERYFSDFVSLEQVDIPASVLEVEDYAFYGCERLGWALIGSRRTKIYKNSFPDWTKKKYVPRKKESNNNTGLWKTK